MPDFAERMRAMLAEVQHNPDVQVLRIVADIPEMDETEAEFAMQEVERLTGVTLEDYFQSYITLADEIGLAWNYRLDGDERSGGEFRLINLLVALGPPRVQLWTDQMDQAEQAFLRQLRPFDDHPYTGDGVMGAFRLAESSRSGKVVTEPAEIWRYASGAPSYRMDIRYDEYVEALLDLRGYHGWHYLFCDIDIHRHYTDLVSHFERMFADLPRLFPATDFAPYRERLERLLS